MERNLNKYDYEKIHQIALAYKEGDKDNAEKIVESFTPFINKYMSFLIDKSFTLNDYSIRNFIGLYNSNIQHYINQFKTKPVIRSIAYDTTEKIHYLLSEYEADEFYSECVCVLLEMANKYKDTKPSFHMYIKKCFHFYLKKHFDMYTSKSILDNDIDLYNIESMIYIEESEQFVDAITNANKDLLYSKNDLYVNELHSEYSDEHIKSINWEIGITCREEFKLLTNFERKIIIQSFLNNKSDMEIGNEYGLCREAMNRKKKHAISKIE